jgi:hypothetical protein
MLVLGSHVRIRRLKKTLFAKHMAHDVFISYSAQDKPTADAVCAKLESRGVRCWIAPRDILGGEEYAAALVNALRTSRLMVLIFSSGANQSQQVLREVERAVSKGLPILPLRIEDVPPSEAMEFYISSRHWLDALTPPLENHLLRLTDTVTLLLSRLNDGPRVTEFRAAMDVVPMPAFPAAERVVSAPFAAAPAPAAPIEAPMPLRPISEIRAEVTAPVVVPASSPYVPPTTEIYVPPAQTPVETAIPSRADRVIGANAEIKKPFVAFVLNFFIAGAGFVYLGRWKSALLNFAVVCVVGIFFLLSSPDSFSGVSIVIAVIDGSIAKIAADRMNAQLGGQTAQAA